MPKRDRNGDESSPGLVVAPMKVKGRISITCVRADDDVQLVILECGVEFFFEHWLHAVDFVEEQHLAFAQVGEDRGKVALDLQRRAGGLLEAYVQLICNDRREGGFSQARRPKEEDVIEGFTTRLGRLQCDRKLFFGFRLADELAKPAGAQFEFKALLFFGASGADETVWSVVASDGHAEGSVAGVGCLGKVADWLRRPETRFSPPLHA